jgi:preprotein translocase subunit SecE
MAVKAAAEKELFLVRWIKAAIRFIGEVKAELVKVAWPTRDEIIASTWVVLAAVTIVAIWIFAADKIASVLMSILMGIFSS